MRTINKIQCKECGFATTKIGISKHITCKHNMTVDEYVLKHGEYRPRKLYTQLKSTENATGEFQCLICNTVFSTNKRLMHHVQSVHDLDTIKYVKQYIFNNIPQECPCGCGQEVNYLIRPPYKLKCISGHNSKYANGMTGKIVATETKILQSELAIKRGVMLNKKDTSIEIIFKEYLVKNNIRFENQCQTEYGIVDFYLPDHDMYVEVDGSYWHPKIILNLNFNQMSNVINDIRKNKNIKNLIRVRDTDILSDNISLNCIDLTDDIYIDNYINFLSREFLIKYKSNKGSDKLRQKVNLILKFIQTISSTFPYDDVNNVNVIKAYNKLSNCNSVLEDNVFYNNRCSSIGSRELKSIFKSFYRSKNLKSYTPEEVWKNDVIMRRLIEYRIGLNKNSETFNISLNQIRRAITVNKYTVSWFKPHLAMSIYSEFIVNKLNPVVLDPCAGFGARMLGFYAAYPNGTYIGIEPNKETYNELILLNEILGKNSILINDRYENINIESINYDIAFTSIPYWNTEIYSTDHTKFYTGYQEWKDTFLNKIKNTKNMIVNVPATLYNEFDNIESEYYLKNNTSHFNTKQNDKFEYVLKLNN